METSQTWLELVPFSAVMEPKAVHGRYTVTDSFTGDRHMADASQRLQGPPLNHPTSFKTSVCLHVHLKASSLGLKSDLCVRKCAA